MKLLTKNKWNYCVNKSYAVLNVMIKKRRENENIKKL